MTNDELINIVKPAFAEYSIMTIDQAEMQSLISANIGKAGISPFMLERVKVPAGGGLFWLVPSLDGEIPMREVEGIICHFRDLRAFWPKKSGNGGTGAIGGPPDCFSEDALVGHGRRFDGDEDATHDCLSCRFAQFGSDPRGGRGQACSARRAVFLLRPDTILPWLFMLPPTSIQPCDKFFIHLMSYRIPFYGAVVRIGLEKRQNAVGQDFSRAVFGRGRPLSADERAKIESLRRVLCPALDRTRMPVDDLFEGNNGGV